MRLLSVLCLLLAIITVACKTKKYTKNTLPVQQLIFGSGGGFTGEVQTYILLNNGQLFYISSLTKDTTEQISIKAQEARKLFKQVSSINLKVNGFRHPGNMYYFIRERKRDTTYSASWGSASFTPPATVTDFYKSLNQIIK